MINHTNPATARPPPGEVLMVIGADTVVALEDRIMEKPATRDEAKEMLRELCGKTHFVYTGVTVWELSGTNGAAPQETIHFITKTLVKFANFSNAVIDSYVETGESMDKAGGYGIQGYGRGLVEYVTGDYFNVVGFPCHDFCVRFAERLETMLGPSPRPPASAAATSDGETSKKLKQ